MGGKRVGHARARALALGMAAGISAVSLPADAQSLGDALRTFLHDDAALTVHVRSYFFDRTNPVPAPSNTAWAGGGWIGFETGWFYDALRFGIVGYTSQPLVAPQNTPGSLLLGPDQEGYSVLGQAWGKLRLWDQEFTGYRQLVNQPEVNPFDNRMTPNTFEAYLLSGTVPTAWGDFGYTAGYVAKIKPRNATTFINMARQAGAPDTVSEGMMLAGFSWGPGETYKARWSGYLVPNTLASSYADGSAFFTLADEVDLRLGAQFMVQGSVGNHALGQPFSTWAGGIDADLILGNVTLTASYTQTGSAAAYRTPYGTWAGYTSMIVHNFNRANEGAFLAGATIDFGFLKAPGFALSTNIVFGNGAMNALTGRPLARHNEYDFTLDYLFANSALPWPDVLRPLWIRARAGLLDQFEPGGGFSTVRDYRVILNYEWKFGGKKG